MQEHALQELVKDQPCDQGSGLADVMETIIGSHGQHDTVATTTLALALASLHQG